MSDRLEGAKLKVERANKQIREIADLVGAFVASNPYEFISEDDAVNRVHLLKMRVLNKYPAMINVIIGECLFNLRSALDQIMYATTVRNDVEIIKHNGFPIERTVKKFERVILERQIEKRLPAVAATLRELQPYEGGNGLLWRLHWLNALDKHRRIVPVGSIHTGMKFEAALQVPAFADGLKFSYPTADSFKVLGEENILLKADYGFELKCDVEMTLNVAFRDVESERIELVLPTLQQFSDTSASIIKIFERRFFSN